MVGDGVIYSMRLYIWVLSLIPQPTSILQLMNHSGFKADDKGKRKGFPGKTVLLKLLWDDLFPCGNPFTARAMDNRCSYHYYSDTDRTHVLCPYWLHFSLLMLSALQCIVPVPTFFRYLSLEWSLIVMPGLLAYSCEITHVNPIRNVKSILFTKIILH